jgi:hypothetical protein
LNIDNEVKTLVFDDFVRYKKDLVSFVNFLLEGDEPVEHMTGIGNTSAHPLKKRGLHESRLVSESYLPQSIKDIVNYTTRFLSGSVPVIPNSVWFHKTNDAGYHDVHIHQNTEYACIFCIDAAECDIDTKNGVNRFYDFSDPEEIHMKDIVPIDGQLVYFHGLVPHSALPYSGETDRIVMGINYERR